MRSPNLPAVHDAVMRHELSEVTQAVQQGADVDAPDHEGRTALFYAAKDGDSAIASALIQHGANVNAQDKGLKTPLHFAANAYQPEVVELLLKHGAKIDAQDVHGNTPLSDAVFDSRGRGQVIEVLLSSGANKTLKNKHGVSPEDLAKSIGNYDISKFLIR